MPNYIGLYKLTDQGVKAIKDAPGRVEAAIKAAEKMGGKVIGFYAVTGEYDYVAIGGRVIRLGGGIAEGLGESAPAKKNREH